MEHEKIEGVGKKIWHIVKAVLFMIRKGICKRKILLDLNVMMKRGKLAGKSLRNLMSHHHHHFSAASVAANEGEYEFSCSNTPLYRHFFTNNKRKNLHLDDVEAINKVLERMMMMSSNSDVVASPGLEFGRSPVARQLRITDSPFPLKGNPHVHVDLRVDDAAEDFINKFYSQLKQQKHY